MTQTAHKTAIGAHAVTTVGHTQLQRVGDLQEDTCRKPRMRLSLLAALWQSSMKTGLVQPSGSCFGISIADILLYDMVTQEVEEAVK